METQGDLPLFQNFFHLSGLLLWPGAGDPEISYAHKNSVDIYILQAP